MDKNLMDEVRSGIKHWYIPLIIGIVFLGAGLYTMFQPLESYVALAMLFGIVFLVSGFSEIIMAFTTKNVNANWVLLLFLGIIDAVIGFMLVSNVEFSMEVLPLYVGFMILFRSINAISYYSQLNAQKVAGAGSFLFMGVLGIIIAMFMLFSPTFGGITIIIWTAMAFILSGVYGIFLGFKLRELR